MWTRMQDYTGLNLTLPSTGCVSLGKFLSICASASRSIWQQCLGGLLWRLSGITSISWEHYSLTPQILSFKSIPASAPVPVSELTLFFLPLSLQYWETGFLDTRLSPIHSFQYSQCCLDLNVIPLKIPENTERTVSRLLTWGWRATGESVPNLPCGFIPWTH